MTHGKFTSAAAQPDKWPDLYSAIIALFQSHRLFIGSVVRHCAAQRSHTKDNGCFASAGLLVLWSRIQTQHTSRTRREIRKQQRPVQRSRVESCRRSDGRLFSVFGLDASRRCCCVCYGQRWLHVTDVTTVLTNFLGHGRVKGSSINYVSSKWIGRGPV